MTDKTTLYNQALSSAGVRGSIADPSEQSVEADKCNLFYDTTRREVLAMAHWPSAKKHARIVRYKTRDEGANWVEGDPSPQYKYAYIVPTDAVHPRHLDTFQEFDYSLIEDDRKMLMTDAESPVLEYTKDQTNIALWDPLLFTAMVEALAAKICLPLGGKRTFSHDAIDRANLAIRNARAATANIANEDYDSPASWIAARGGVGGAPVGRFIYPMRTLYLTTRATPSVA